jgi:hypothetical protein
MDTKAINTVFVESLDSQNDDTLRAGRRRIDELLTARKNKSQAQALAQIRRILNENGLDWELKKKPGKRGRPRKTDSTS